MSAGKILRELKGRMLKRVCAFVSARRGNVAMIFALALIPLCLAAGAGLDYARAVVVRSNMAEAIDAAALAVGSSPGLTTAQMRTLAQQYFNANYKADPSFGTPAAIVVTPGTQQITVSVTSQMPTTLLSVIGINALTVSASNKVVWGQMKLWVALVLDNTSSMTESDYTGTSKMTALKTASQSLLTMLKNASSIAGDVQVAVIPFSRDVNIGTSYSNAAWLGWTDFNAGPGAPSTSVGPGSACPWQDKNQGYHCQASPTNGSASVTTIPNSGTYKGYICPSANTVGHYYNGCYDSVQSGSKYTHTWKPNPKSSWSGCITDRDRNYDVQNTTPSAGTPATLFVAENSPYCPGATILPLGYDWTKLNNKINSMVANGSTNQTIGLAWGLQALTQGAPLSPPALPENTQRVIILLSDGLNTQNRWDSSSDFIRANPQVDARMALACANAKAAGITVYTVFVDLNGTQGNSAVLQNCASDAGKYFDLTTSGAIISTFNQIGQQITNLRVAQ
ncbi:MAG TPA: pilus assembly protein TadG-related protein [Rhizomicrobium sp.]